MGCRSINKRMLRSTCDIYIYTGHKCVKLEAGKYALVPLVDMHGELPHQ